MRYILVLILMFSVPCMKAECKKKQYKTLPLTQVEIAKNTLLKSRQRTDLINYLIAKNGYQKYLEIGVADGENLKQINAPEKVGVDPSPAAPATYRMTSDEFFLNNHDTFDIVFIDGLHLHEQVLRDIQNSLSCLNPGGIIVMHDCMPVRPEHQSRTIIPGAWNGDVWKAAAYVRMNWDGVQFCVLDMDWGCGVLTPNSTQILYPSRPIEDMDWEFYVNNKTELLNVKSVENWLIGL